MGYSSGWWEQMFAPAYSLGQSNLQLGQIQSWAVLRASCKEESLGLPEEEERQVLIL